jgi:pSer/pThr/pTyr-binding forkhead associated (FHA) protein
MRCSACGHESPPGSSFCLNCGTALAAAGAKTPVPGGGLPVMCSGCRNENPPGMKFCRFCGTALVQTTPGSPALAPAVGAPMMAPPAMAPPAMAPPAMAPPAMAPPASYAPSAALVAVAGTPAPAGPPRAQGSTIACPRCGTATPIGFAYCQQCGLHLHPVAPTDPGSIAGGPRIRPPTNVPPPGQGQIDAHSATLAADGVQSGSILPPGARPSSPSSPPPRGPSGLGPTDPGPAPRPSSAGTDKTAPPPDPRAAGAAWGSAVLVNRDGSDGQRFPLTSLDIVIGRAGADIAFDEDRFLARQHARIERAADCSVKLHPIDTINGVFKKTEGSVELADGTIILVGREVLRFERVTPEERTVHPLVRHGVALFGSPPREPWGRLLQLIPSGGFRDVRHLSGEEVVLGREEGDIVFRDDAFMSRRHAAITWDGRRALLTDLGSSNGSFVRVPGPTSLKHGDHVRMGDQLLRIER